MTIKRKQRTVFIPPPPYRNPRSRLNFNRILKDPPALTIPCFSTKSSRTVVLYPLYAAAEDATDQERGRQALEGGRTRRCAFKLAIYMRRYHQLTG
ncbi:hypothetical protein GWI33_015270 [Rhynchophorus ferrugineus]|uniref:Uncharacterized protein n=1 Tax=Rhynchophorus ferrugineus TaxID=354439 RepID=A0A834MBL0_RHYFE|nr:hypothetical protein GWI33_015270 [Rhynchophorus ferrugineus]